MNYNIFDRTAPAMPTPAKGTEIVKLLLSQVSKDIQEPLVPMFFPILGAHISDAEFQYPDVIRNFVPPKFRNLKPPEIGKVK